MISLLDPETVLSSDFLEYVMDKNVIFIHIPKTAGTSLLSTLQNTFADQFVRRIYQESASYQSDIDYISSKNESLIKCAVGHIPTFDIIASLENGELQGFSLFTVLRDPVERVLSLFRFFSAHCDEDLKSRGLTKGFSLKTFLSHDFPEIFGQVSNGMVRFICGDKDLFDSKSEKFRLLTLEEELKKAKSFLTAIDFGITEQMKDTLTLAQSAWNIPFEMQEYRENTTIADPMSVTSEDLELIRSLNHSDIKLYEWACSEFAFRMQRHLEFRNRAWNKNAIWLPVIGEPALISAIPGRVGFHEFEEIGLSWLRQGDRSKIHFLTTMTNLKINMTIRAISIDYPMNDINLSINETPLAFQLVESGNQWWKLECDSFSISPGFGILSIECPRFISVQSFDPQSKDRRSLAVAVRDVCFLSSDAARGMP